MLVLAGHTEGAHVKRNRSNLGFEQKLLHLWHIPRSRSVWVLVDEVPLSLKLNEVYLEAEPDVGFGLIELVLHDPRVALGSANLLQRRERRAWR